MGGFGGWTSLPWNSRCHLWNYNPGDHLIPKSVSEESAKNCFGFHTAVEVALRPETWSTFLGTPAGAGTFRNIFSALLLSRVLGTSADGRQDCNPGAHSFVWRLRCVSVTALYLTSGEHLNLSWRISRQICAFSGRSQFMNLFQDDGRGGLGFKGVAFMTVLVVLTVLRFWRAPRPPFACPTKYNAKRRPWRFWQFWRLLRFRS